MTAPTHQTLRARRLELGMKQAALTYLISRILKRRIGVGVTQPTVSRWEAGLQQPGTPAHWRAWRAALGLKGD